VADETGPGSPAQFLCSVLLLCSVLPPSCDEYHGATFPAGRVDARATYRRADTRVRDKGETAVIAQAPDLPWRLLVPPEVPRMTSTRG
jgi:hypothetical protein